jgi:Domain of unknown function (DUF3806)
VLASKLPFMAYGTRPLSNIGDAGATQMNNDKQKIEPPTEDEVTSIARALIHADDVCKEALGTGLDGTRADLSRIQQIVDSGFVAREATYTLQALGMAFGKVFVNDNDGYDWWMVQDEYGRDPAIRFRRTTLLAFPRTMLSKRVEDGESIDVSGLYDQLRGRLSELVDDGYT